MLVTAAVLAANHLGGTVKAKAILEWARAGKIPVVLSKPRLFDVDACIAALTRPAANPRG